MIDLRLPHFAGSDREQLAQIRSYLYQLVSQLQFAMSSMETSGVSSYVAPMQLKQTVQSTDSIDAEEAFSVLKTLPLPRAQVSAGYDPNSLGNGIHIVANNALKQGDTVIMYNGVLIQMNGDVGGNVKLQLALPVDENRNPMYRICWYSNWTNWRSMKL